MMKQIDFQVKRAGQTWNAYVLKGFAAEARRQGIDPDILMKTAQVATAVPPAQTKSKVPAATVPNAATRPLTAAPRGMMADGGQPFVPGTTVAPYSVDRRDPTAELYKTSPTPAVPVQGTLGGAAAHPTATPAPVAQAPKVIHRSLNGAEASATAANDRANQAYRKRLIDAMRFEARQRGQNPDFKTVGNEELTRRFELQDGTLGLDHGLRSMSRIGRGLGARVNHGWNRLTGASMAGEGMDQSVKDRWFGGGEEADLYRYNSAAYNKAFGGTAGKNLVLAGPRGPRAQDVGMQGVDGKTYNIKAPNTDPNFVATRDAKGNLVYADRSTLPWGGRPPPMSRRSALTVNTDPQPLV